MNQTPRLKLVHMDKVWANACPNSQIKDQRVASVNVRARGSPAWPSPQLVRVDDYSWEKNSRRPAEAFLQVRFPQSCRHLFIHLSNILIIIAFLLLLHQHERWRVPLQRCLHVAMAWGHSIAQTTHYYLLSLQVLHFLGYSPSSFDQLASRCSTQELSTTQHTALCAPQILTSLQSL